MTNSEVRLDRLASTLYSSARAAMSRESSLLPSSLSPALTTALAQIPAASYEGGTRIEIYAGGSTIVVFADDPAVANLAAASLGMRLAADGVAQPASTLANSATGVGCPS